MKVTQKGILATWPTLTKKAAYLITRLCNGTYDPETFSAGQRRVSECYNRPSQTDLILTVVNSLFNTYGIVAHGVEGVPYYENAMRDGEFIEYVNMGDTYRATILHNPEMNRFEISDWGSLYETSPEYAAQSAQDEDSQDEAV